MTHREIAFHKRVDRSGPEIRFLTLSDSKQRDFQLILTAWFPDLIVKNPTAVSYTDAYGGVVFTEAPQEKPFNLRAVLKDLCGNSDTLLEPGASHG